MDFSAFIPNFAEWTHVNWLEVLGAVLGVIAVTLRIRRNIWCWPIGVVMVVITIYLCHVWALRSDMILYIIYLPMQFYGWYFWSKGQRDEVPQRVFTLSNRSRLLWLVGIVGGTFLWAQIVRRAFERVDFLYPDAFTSVTSLVAEWLTARRCIETWWLWVVVNVVATGMYWIKGARVYSVLYFFFLILAIVGWKAWRAVRARQFEELNAA